VEEYERSYDIGHAAPLDALKHVMEDRGLRQREISKEHARRLATFFSVPASMFI